jgi:16S rRNA A1518/A1519 N6-dimethyltransferase RsmA/KsgA/DIM1 with predicted DNA glycosylase/AP lyase activity
MNLKPNSRLVEFGPGWGNTTLHFAQMGYEVTAVDLEKSFIDLIKYRAEIITECHVSSKDMLGFVTSEKYDAAVFLNVSTIVLII